MSPQTRLDYERDLYVRREKTFFPVDIPVLYVRLPETLVCHETYTSNSHSQLRHLVSSTAPDIVYFASSRTIYRLNTKTKKRARVATLTFDVRSTASGHGWFCAGGEREGRFATISLPEDDVDDQNPSSNGIGGSEDTLPDNPWLRTTRVYGEHSRRARFITHEENLGSDIVNSISIHKVPIANSSGQEILEPVALVTQNDHYVRLYHLSESREIWRSERFDWPMNHATLSPDGKLMIIVGDKDVGFVYERSSFSARHRPRYEQLRTLQLHRPSDQKVSTYFTTAWSDTGRLCATASEHGYLMVFESAKLSNPEADPVLVVVPASRAMQSPGAIRTMCFAPSPWDLLMWTENYGRMCIANLRDGLSTKQVIELDPHADGVVPCEFEDDPLSAEAAHEIIDRNLEYLRRHRRDLSDDPDALRIASEFMTASAERRRLQRQAGVPDLGGLGGLGEDEQQIINNLRTTRERELERQQNINSTPRPGVSRTAAYPQYERPRSWTGIPRALSQALDDEQQSRHDAWQTIERAMQRTTQLSRAPTQDELPDDDLLPPLTRGGESENQPSPAPTTRATLPTVRDSLSILEAERARARASAARLVLEPNDDSLTTRGEIVRARQQRAANASAGGEQLSRSSSASTYLFHLGNPSRRPTLPTSSDVIRQRNLHGASEPEADRGYSVQPTRSWQTMHHRVRLGGIVDVEDRSTWGDGTTGVSCSSNGKTVYVGTETGIFQLCLDYSNRRFWPALELR